MGKDGNLSEKVEHVVEDFLVDDVGSADWEGEPHDKYALETSGKGAGRILTEDDRIYDLVDIVEDVHQEVFTDYELDDEIAKKVSEIAERIAREIVPGIAERIIREEIENLKRYD